VFSRNRPFPFPPLCTNGRRRTDASSSGGGGRPRVTGRVGGAKAPALRGAPGERVRAAGGASARGSRPPLRRRRARRSQGLSRPRRKGVPTGRRCAPGHTGEGCVIPRTAAPRGIPDETLLNFEEFTGLRLITRTLLGIWTQPTLSKSEHSFKHE
jgi:hypothetical protein